MYVQTRIGVDEFKYAACLNVINALQGGSATAGGENEPLMFVNNWNRFIKCNTDSTCQRLIGGLHTSIAGVNTFVVNPNQAITHN